MESVKRTVSQSPTSSKDLSTHVRKNPDDVVITLAIRSPLCRARKGGFKDTRNDELMTEIIKHAISRSNFNPALIGDICVGNVLDPKATYAARASALAAGVPVTVPVQTINRFCSSGLMATTTIANQITAGQIDIGLAVGCESMSEFADTDPTFSEEIQAHPAGRDCIMPMGWTSENVASDFDISRQDMDELAALSFQRAERAQKAGYFDNEIVPFKAFVKDTTGQRKPVVILKDDGIKYGTTKETLGRIRSAFPQWGKGATTGGNASQITDGAAAVMLMRRSKAEELGLKILAKYVTTAVSGLEPRIMGIGPSLAVPKVLDMTGIDKSEVDLFEINEAFASMYVYCVRKLNLDIQKVNVNGGAIAFGHPLDEYICLLCMLLSDVSPYIRCTGARQIATGLSELSRRNGKVLVISMCIGTGQGAAAVFIRE